MLSKILLRGLLINLVTSLAKIITVGGGKGGTGKSIIATNIAVGLFKRGYNVLLVDADVESPVDHILLDIKREKIDEVVGFAPIINSEKCIKCGLCANKCPEHALVGLPGKVPILIESICEGCSICKLVCPVDAIGHGDRLLGSIYSGRWKGMLVIQGEVNPGVRQHVNVTAATMDYASRFFDKHDYVIIDSSPGTGANVWLTLKIADFVIAVTEPTPLGLSDLKKYLSLVEDLGKKYIILLNKSDIKGGQREPIISISRDRGVGVYEVKYDVNILRAYIEKKPILEYNPRTPGALDILALVDTIEKCL